MNKFLLALRIALFIALISLFFPVYASDYGDHAAKVVRVHDGDTLTVTVQEWPEFIRVVPVRVFGIDAPEIKGKCAEEKAMALQAKALTTRFVSNGGIVTLSKIRRDKYFRLLANVHVGEKSLADELLSAGLARTYLGGKKLGWCQK